MDIHGGQMDYLKKAFDGMETELTRFLEDSCPDWIIYDFAPQWLPHIAARLGISRAFFLIMNAWFLAFFGPADALISGSDDRTKHEDFTVPPKWVKLETKVAYRRFEANWMTGSGQKNDSGYSDCYRLGNVIVGSEAILVRHCFEFEPEWLTLLEELYHRPIVPVGLLPPREQDHNTNKHDDDESWVSIRNWLDGQDKGSVVYVALGSEVTPSQDQLNELAHGLEFSGVPFFWVLRKASGSTESEPVELPGGFEERVSNRGIVWWRLTGWILDSLRLEFYIVEGLVFACPLITLPFLVDQGLNSRVVAGKQLGVEIPRNEQDGSYTRNSVADSVKLVMLINDGKKFREKAKEMSAVFGDTELHSRYIDKSIDFLENDTSMPRSTLINGLVNYFASWLHACFPSCKYI